MAAGLVNILTMLFILIGIVGIIVVAWVRWEIYLRKLEKRYDWTKDDKLSSLEGLPDDLTKMLIVQRYQIDIRHLIANFQTIESDNLSNYLKKTLKWRRFTSVLLKNEFFRNDLRRYIKLGAIIGTVFIGVMGTENFTGYVIGFFGGAIIGLGVFTIWKYFQISGEFRKINNSLTSQVSENLHH